MLLEPESAMARGMAGRCNHARTPGNVEDLTAAEGRGAREA
jgi:hypothetical protein